MRLKECSFIQELLPLYAENLVSEETTALINEHLAGCAGCAQEWENFIEPLPDPVLLGKFTPEKGIENKIFKRLKITVAAVVLFVVMSGAGLAYASYTAGKHVGTDDPAYRFAQELGLFTEIDQTKNIDGLRVTLNKGLFDSTRSVLFINLSSSANTIPQVLLADESGKQYEQRRAKGWQNKYFMFEFEPVGLEAQQLTVSLSLDEEQEDRTEFTFPVDVVKTAQYTKIVYPNQEEKLSSLKITLEKAILGVSESEFKVRFDWPTDNSVAGLGLGRGSAYFPTSVRKVPDTPPPPGMGAPSPGGLTSGYASTVGINYCPQDPPVNRPALYDLTERQEVEVEGAEYRTTQFPCQVMAILKFAPVKRETEQLELLLPPVYLYKKVADSPKIQLNFEEKNELNLERSVPFPQGKIIIEKAWLEKKQVYFSYRLETSAKPENIAPHFVLLDKQGMKQGSMRFDKEEPQVIVFSVHNEGAKEFDLSLDSIGQLLLREKFSLDLQEK
jgi:hypothetical protein